MLVTGGIVRRIHSPVVLTKELLALPFGEVSQDHQRICVVFRRLCGHVTQLTLVCCTHLPAVPARMKSGYVRRLDRCALQAIVPP